MCVSTAAAGKTLIGSHQLADGNSPILSCLDIAGSQEVVFKG